MLCDLSGGTSGYNNKNPAQQSESGDSSRKSMQLLRFKKTKNCKW